MFLITSTDFLHPVSIILNYEENWESPGRVLWLYSGKNQECETWVKNFN